MRHHRILFGATVFLSSALLFVLQPLAARRILPVFGGSAAVWTTTTLFFTVVLLAGYLYADLLRRYLRPSLQAALHLVLLAASGGALWWGSGPETSGSGLHPVLSILKTLQLSVGLPFFVLSTTSPLVQSWYARTIPGRLPYRLFAVSNLASLAALVAYPIVIEQFLTLRLQSAGWSTAYAVFAVLCAASAVVARRGAVEPEPATGGDAGAQPWLWVLLAFIPSLLWISVANHLSQSVAPIPFVWVLPLSLYLLSFVLAFESERWHHRRGFRVLLALAWLGLLSGMFAPSTRLRFEWILTICCASLWIICTFFHVSLAERKPGARRLTMFYLCVSAGGALGSAFVSLVAPVAFDSYMELPVALLLSVIAGVPLAWGGIAKGTAVRWAATTAAALVAALTFQRDDQRNVLAARNFYGAIRVQEESSSETARRSLYHGNILHGTQWLAPSRSHDATTYYSAESGVGQVLQAEVEGPRRIGAIGLGVGTIATYGRAGDSFRFYEINPMIAGIARIHFRYLRECPARVDVIEGDGRLRMETEPPLGLDVLVLDAFSGDSVPVHLLTREAFATWFRHLKPEGVLVVHVTNRYLELAPLVRRLANEFGRVAVRVHNRPNPAAAVSESDWVVAGSGGAIWEQVRANGRPIAPGGPLWTDDFNNLLQVLR